MGSYSILHISKYEWINNFTFILDNMYNHVYCSYISKKENAWTLTKKSPYSICAWDKPIYFASSFFVSVHVFCLWWDCWSQLHTPDTISCLHSRTQTLSRLFLGFTLSDKHIHVHISTCTHRFSCILCTLSTFWNLILYSMLSFFITTGYQIIRTPSRQMCRHARTCTTVWTESLAKAVSRCLTTECERERTLCNCTQTSECARRSGGLVAFSQIVHGFNAVLLFGFSSCEK